jgi:hypothetical protein
LGIRHQQAHAGRSRDGRGKKVSRNHVSVSPNHRSILRDYIYHNVRPFLNNRGFPDSVARISMENGVSLAALQPPLTVRYDTNISSLANAAKVLVKMVGHPKSPPEARQRPTVRENLRHLAPLLVREAGRLSDQ